MSTGSTNTAVSNRRRSRRVFLKIRVVVQFRQFDRDSTLDGETMVVNAHGGALQLPMAVMPGQNITLTNPATDQVEACRVVRVETLPTNGFEVAFAFERPSPQFWAIAFPPSDWIESVVEHETH
jgi:hypothetical protein